MRASSEEREREREREKGWTNPTGGLKSQAKSKAKREWREESVKGRNDEKEGERRKGSSSRMNSSLGASDSSLPGRSDGYSRAEKEGQVWGDQLDALRT